MSENSYDYRNIISTISEMPETGQQVLLWNSRSLQIFSHDAGHISPCYLLSFFFTKDYLVTADRFCKTVNHASSNKIPRMNESAGQQGAAV